MCTTAGPMSTPKPVGTPGGSIIVTGWPSSAGNGRRRGRMGRTLGRITAQSRSGGSRPIAPRTSSGALWVTCSLMGTCR